MFRRLKVQTQSGGCFSLLSALAVGFVLLLASSQAQFVYVANGGGSNNVSAYRIAENGALSPIPGSPFAAQFRGSRGQRSEVDRAMARLSSGIHWVIVGGESGPGARPIEAAWLRDIRKQCCREGVPFFFKQWGGVQKKKNGRVLDGWTWDGMPKGHLLEA